MSSNLTPSAILRQRAVDAYYRNPTRCKQCGDPIKVRLDEAPVMTRRRRYCSPTCKERKSIEHFRRKHVAGVLSWRKRAKQRAVEYKGGKCQRCGYCRCAWAMDFHHIDPAKKDFQIGGKTISWERLQKELDKCALLCAICHRELHAGLWLLEDLMPVGEIGITVDSDSTVRGS